MFLKGTPPLAPLETHGTFSASSEGGRGLRSVRTIDYTALAWPMPAQIEKIEKNTQLAHHGWNSF